MAVGEEAGALGGDQCVPPENPSLVDQGASGSMPGAIKGLGGPIRAILRCFRFSDCAEAGGAVALGRSEAGPRAGSDEGGLAVFPGAHIAHVTGVIPRTSTDEEVLTLGHQRFRTGERRITLLVSLLLMESLATLNQLIKSGGKKPRRPRRSIPDSCDGRDVCGAALYRGASGSREAHAVAAMCLDSPPKQSPHSRLKRAPKYVFARYMNPPRFRYSLRASDEAALTRSGAGVLSAREPAVAALGSLFHAGHG